MINQNETSHVTRLEVIDNDGRSYVKYNIDKIQFSLQDDDRTLKLFVKHSNYQQPNYEWDMSDAYDQFDL
jgi:hypothetical protein